MSYNNALEKKRFQKEWQKIRVEYEAAGMDEDSIQKMYDFDWKYHLSNRRYREHTQPLNEKALEDEDDGMSPLLEKFAECISCSMDFAEGDLGFWRVEEIEDGRLAARLKALPTASLELMILFAVDGYTQTEIARLQHTTRQNICNKISRIKKILR